MTPEKIIEQATLDGLTLDLTDAGELHYFGTDEAVARWLPVLRGNKPSILAVLQEAANDHALAALAPTDRQLIEAVCRIWEADAEDLEVALEAARRDPSLIDCWRGSAVRLGLIRGRLQ
jgi:hypothetical protein